MASLTSCVSGPLRSRAAHTVALAAPGFGNGVTNRRNIVRYGGLGAITLKLAGLKQLLDFVTRKCLEFQQGFGEQVQLLAMLLEQMSE